MIKSKVNKVRLVTLAIGLLTIVSPVQSANSVNTTIEDLGTRLEEALNKNDNNTLNLLIEDENASEIKKSLKNFSKRFPNSKWKVSIKRLNNKGKGILKVEINGDNQSKEKTHSITTEQILSIQIAEGKIKKQEVISEQSVLQTNKTPLAINIGIPNIVLTGSRYDVDIYLEEPLGDVILAGGLINIESTKNAKGIIPSIELNPLGGGGLFKSVYAPLEPGQQKWAALIVHPDGIISISKKVKVVEKKSELNLMLDFLKTEE